MEICYNGLAWHAKYQGAKNLTLCVKEVADRNGWVTLLDVDRGVSEHFVFVALGSDAHVFLMERLSMCIDVGILLCLWLVV